MTLKKKKSKTRAKKLGDLFTRGNPGLMPLAAALHSTPTTGSAHHLYKRGPQALRSSHSQLLCQTWNKYVVMWFPTMTEVGKGLF